MAVAVLSKPLGSELCRKRGDARVGAYSASVPPLGETTTQCGTFSFVFIRSNDPRNPTTLSGKRREDGAYILFTRKDGGDKVIGVLVPLNGRDGIEQARKSGVEIWGSMDTLDECRLDGQVCLIRGVDPYLFKEHFILKRGVYKDEM